MNNTVLHRRVDTADVAGAGAYLGVNGAPRYAQAYIMALCIVFVR